MTSATGLPYRTTAPGKGVSRTDEGSRRIVISFDPETFAKVRHRALKANTSFAEQVRLLTEWGLEVDEA